MIYFNKLKQAEERLKKLETKTDRELVEVNLVDSNGNTVRTFKFYDKGVQ